MARPRKQDTHLPAYVRMRGAVYWYEPRGETPVRLGDTLPQAMARYHEIIARPEALETVEHLIARYILDALPARKGETQRKYRASLVLLRAFFGGMRARDVRPKHVYQYLDQRRDTPTAGNRDIAVLSAVFAEGMRWGAVDVNPCLGVHRHSEHPRTRAVTDTELAAWCRFAPPLIAGYTALKALTGMRQQDLLALTMDQVMAPDGITYTVEKSLRRDRAGRTAPGKVICVMWTADLRQAVAWCVHYRGDADPGPLFRTRTGTHYTGSGFRAIWQRAMVAAVADGVLAERFTDHDIRAKAATDARAQGLDATALLGHSDPSVTQRHYLRGPAMVQPVGKSGKSD